MFDRDKLKKYIDNLGIKQKVIAQKSNMSETTLSNILNGKRKCEVNEFLSICNAISVNPNEFIKTD